MTPPPSTIPSLRAARTGLVILTLINLLNYLDRWIVSALVESLKKSELHLTDLQAGSLTTGFVIVYMLTSPFFGTLGDRKSRTGLIAFGVALWSFATALGGFVRSFTGLFLARATVGIGEAAYGTIAPTLLADYYPISQRGRIFAVFFSAIPIGSALGYAVGGLMDQHFGWRAAFYVAGIPGILLAFLVLRLPDPPRGIRDIQEGNGPPVVSPPNQEGKSTWGSYRDLLRNRPYLFTVLGYAAYTFAVGGMAFWMPAFLERMRGVPRVDATVQFGLIVVATGFVGTFAGGWIGDYFLKRSSQAYLWVSGIATLVAAPITLAALTVKNPGVYFPAIIVAELLLFASTGPINSAIVNSVAPNERATAIALSVFTIHLLGDVPSPTLIGAISDASNLGQAVCIVPIAILVSGLVWSYAALRGDKSSIRKGSPRGC